MTLFWISLVRAAFALFLGIAMVGQPDKTWSHLATFMGVYWLLSGALNLWQLHAGSRRLRLVGVAGGWIGLATGAGVLAYGLVGVAEPSLIVSLLGFVIISMGAIHFLGGFEVEGMVGRGLRPRHVFGTIEVVLGSILVFAAPLGKPSFAFLVAGSWAFVAAGMLVAQAFRERSHTRQMRPTENPPH